MRSMLKAQTSAAHTRVDQAISGLCLTDRRQYLTFLRTHQLAYRALLAALPRRNWVTTLVADVLKTLDADIAALDADGPALPMISCTEPLHHLGVAYVICGSHFGKNVLRKRWSRSGDTQMQAAGQYLSSDLLAKGWQHWLRELDGLRDPPRDFHKLGLDADRTFEMFCDCLLVVKQWEHADAAA